MKDVDLLQAISINLLRVGEWYYKDPAGNKAICQRYLDQSKQLARQVRHKPAHVHLKQLAQLSLDCSEAAACQAERCLTLGVILQHPEHLLAAPRKEGTLKAPRAAARRKH